MMRTYLIAVFLLLSALSGCRKEEEGLTTARGRVVDAVTGAGVGGARVRLVRSGGGNNVLTGGGSVALDTVEADGGGNYALSFSAAESYTYEVQGFAPGYLSGWLDAQPLVKLRGGRKNTADVPLRPEGYLRVRVMAPNPVPYSGVAINNFNGSSLRIFSGVNGAPIVSIDTTVTIVYPGGRDNEFSWRVYPNGTNTSSYHSTRVFFPAHDTADFEIRF